MREKLYPMDCFFSSLRNNLRLSNHIQHDHNTHYAVTKIAVQDSACNQDGVTEDLLSHLKYQKLDKIHETTVFRTQNIRQPRMMIQERWETNKVEPYHYPSLLPWKFPGCATGRDNTSRAQYSPQVEDTEVERGAPVAEVCKIEYWRDKSYTEIELKGLQRIPVSTCMSTA